MTNFRKWFKGEYPGGHTSGYYFAHKAWQYRQQEIDQLKAQLNNMEACYIEKKKECELLESNINNLTKQFSDCYEVAYAEYKKNADSYYSGKCDAFDLAEQLAGLALRGAND